MGGLTFFSFISLGVLAVVYYFLITEKINKVIVAVLGAVVLICLQVFRTATRTSQDTAFEFISRNLDVLFFVIGMMILVGIVRESGIFEAAAIWLVKILRGRPIPLLIAFGYLTLFMTVFLSNIPTILILTPVLIILVRELKLPYMPYFMMMITMANIGGAATPISDPTTYYQAKTVGLTFIEVVMNSGLIVLVLSVVSSAYIAILFRKSLLSVNVSQDDVALFRPGKAIRNKRILFVGVPLLVITIFIMTFKEQIRAATGITLDNATLTLGASFLAMYLFHERPKDVFREVIDWEIIFFFMGLFIIVGSLEFTRVIESLAAILIQITGGELKYLLGFVTIGSAGISTFIDNVPYNITMVGAIQTMAKEGINVYPLWWALNLGTSIGGAGSLIAAACNVLAFSQLEKEKFHLRFMGYLVQAFPLVLINALITFFILAVRYKV